VSAIGDALKAIKKDILLEERIASQSRKLELLALNQVEMDKRRPISKVGWMVFSQPPLPSVVQRRPSRHGAILSCLRRRARFDTY
jgi:hypothetical protein